MHRIRLALWRGSVPTWLSVSSEEMILFNIAHRIDDITYFESDW